MRLFFAFLLLPVVDSTLSCENLVDESARAVMASNCDKLGSKNGYTLRISPAIEKTSWDGFISKLTEIHVDIEITSTFLLDELDFSRLTVFDSKSVKIVDNHDLRTIKFPKNCAIKRLEIRDNKQLEDLDAPDMLSSVTELILRANTHLPLYVITSLKLIRKGKTGDDIQPFGECIFPDKVKKLDDLDGCLVVTGDLSFASGIGGVAPPEMRLSLVIGDIDLADLKGKTLNFLNDAVVTGIIKSGICDLDSRLRNPIVTPEKCKQAAPATGENDEDSISDEQSGHGGPDEDNRENPKPLKKHKSHPKRSDTNPAFTTMRLVLLAMAILIAMGALAGLMYCLYWNRGHKPLPKNPAQRALENESEDVARKARETGYYLYERNARRNDAPRLGQEYQVVGEGAEGETNTDLVTGEGSPDRGSGPSTVAMSPKKQKMN